MAAASDADVPKRLRECHLRSADLGSIVGEDPYYARVCMQLPELARDKEPLRVLFAREGGTDVGFAVFRRSHKWDRARPAGEVKVWAVLGEPAARLVLARRLV